jgi:hypothetical protein
MFDSGCRLGKAPVCEPEGQFAVLSYLNWVSLTDTTP